MEALFLLLAALGCLYYLYRRSANWRTILVSSGGNIEEVEAKYAFLKTQQIRCRVRSESSGQLGAIHAGPSAAHRSDTLKLDVHVKDIEKAQLLLEQFEAEQPGQPF